jgi:monofunctional biosynthetic peptidoglycan transglycosylase
MSTRRRRLIAVAPFAALGALWFWWLILPWPVLIRWRDPGTTSFMRLRQAEARAADADYDIRRTTVPLDEISAQLQRAVVLAEDGNFFTHRGIDWEALREEFRYRGDDDFSWFDAGDVRALLASFRYYLANRDEVRGRSTITQQLAKNLYFGEDRSPLRKVEEFVVARRIELFLPKDRILELYLNVVEWGPGVFGAEAAARYYFDRSAARLSRDQAAALAATLPHPLTSNPKRRPGSMNYRKRLILERMARAGPIRPQP